MLPPCTAVQLALMIRLGSNNSSIARCTKVSSTHLLYNLTLLLQQSYCIYFQSGALQKFRDKNCTGRNWTSQLRSQMQLNTKSGNDKQKFFFLLRLKKKLKATYIATQESKTMHNLTTCAWSCNAMHISSSNAMSSTYVWLLKSLSTIQASRAAFMRHQNKFVHDIDIQTYLHYLHNYSLHLKLYLIILTYQEHALHNNMVYLIVQHM